MAHRLPDVVNAQRSNTDGFAQIIVLAGLAIVSGLVVSLQQDAIDNTRMQAALKSTLGTRIAARSAMRRIYSAIENGDDQMELPLLSKGGTLESTEAGLEVRVALEREGGKISLLPNAGALVASYLVKNNLSIPEEFALELTERQLRNSLSLALASGPSSMDADGDFSAFHTSSGIDPASASSRVLRAVPDLSDSQIAAVLAEREHGQTSVTSAYFTSAVTALTVYAKMQTGGDLRSTFIVTAGGSVALLSHFTY